MGEKIEAFEDLIAWQKARILTRENYKVSSVEPLARDFPLRDQMRRSAISIMSNIAEGFERARPNEFHQFLSIAKASCAELRSQLYIALDAGEIHAETFHRVLALAAEVGRILGGLRAAVERRKTSK